MNEDYLEKKPKRVYKAIEPEVTETIVKPKSKLQELFDQRPNFYGGEQGAELMDKIRQLHKFYENMRGLIE